MSDSCDFPAAHSMDTTWFAVDRDGHVAMLQSGESGAVPETVCGDQFYAGPEELAELAGGASKLDWRGIAAGRETPHVKEVPTHVRAHVLVFLRPTDEARAAIAGAAGREIPAVDAIAFEWEAPDAARFAAIHADGLCLACELSFGEREPVPGVYVYDHTEENWISGPYARVSIPDEPVAPSALPPEYLAHAVRFDGRFADTERLQPAEIWKCGSWQPGWLALDGRTVRPFEGQEEEFEDARENLEGQDVEVKPPITDLPEAEVVGAPEPAPEPSTTPAKKPWWKLW